MARDRKAIQSYIDLAEAAGWRVERTPNGHWKFFPNDKSKSIVTATGSPSTRRQRENLRSDLQRSGLVFPDHSGQEPTAQERRLAERVEDLRRVVLDSIEHLAPTEEDVAIIGAADTTFLTTLAILINPEDGRISLTCPCGTTLHRLQGYMKHIASCEAGAQDLADRYKELEKGIEMKRDMTRRPPYRERLQCPECPDWFWISQPDLMEQHMAGEHGMKRCPYCESWERMENGQITKHINSCDNRPEGTPPLMAGSVLPTGAAPRPARQRRTLPDPRQSEAPVAACAPPPGKFPGTSPRSRAKAAERAVTPVPVTLPGERFVWRRTGQKVTASTYHLFTDCRQMMSPGEGVEHVAVDSMVIEMLGLGLCKQCDRRSRAVSVEQFLADWFLTMDEAEDRDALAVQFQIDLAEFGFTIRKGK